MIGVRQPKSPTPPTASALDYIKALGPIALGVLAALQQRGPQFWALFALAVVAFGVAFASPVRNLWRKRLHRTRDRRTARAATPELRRLVRRFAEFVDESRTDTVRAVIYDGLRNNYTAFERLQIRPAHWFSALVRELQVRDAQDSLDLERLARAVGEFHTLIVAYCDQCVQPIFEQLPREDRQLLVGACGPALESFRERYVAFRDDYEQYVQRLAHGLHAPPLLPANLPRPKPLAS
jgi:hypothetical protein